MRALTEVRRHLVVLPGAGQFLTRLTAPNAFDLATIRCGIIFMVCGAGDNQHERFLRRELPLTLHGSLFVTVKDSPEGRAQSR
jgi:hypothetical protein